MYYLSTSEIKGSNIDYKYIANIVTITIVQKLGNTCIDYWL